MSGLSPSYTLGSVAREASIRFSGLVVDKLLGYAFALFVAKTYGPTEFGLYLFGVGIFEIVLGLSGLGLERSAVRAVARYAATGEWAEIRAVVRTTLTLVVPLGSIAAVGIATFAAPISNGLDRPELAGFLRVISIALPVTLVVGALVAPIEGLGQQKHTVLARMIVDPAVKCAVAGLLFLVIGDTVTVDALAAAFATGVVASALVAFVAYRRVVVPRIAGHSSEWHVASLLRVGLPVCATTVLARLLAWTNIFLVFALVSSEATTHYAVAQRTALLVVMVAHASDAAFRPAIAAALAEGRTEALTENFGRVSRLVLTLCLPACVMLVFFAGRVSLVLGEQFVEASPVMSLIALGTLAGFLAGPAASALTMAGRSGIPFRHSVVAGAVGLGLSLTLIPRLGLLGAGVAQCTVMCLTALLDTVAARRLLGVLGVGRAHLRLLAAAAVATCAGMLASSIAPANRYVAFLLVGSAVVAAYGLALVLFGVVRWGRGAPSIAS